MRSPLLGLTILLALPAAAHADVLSLYAQAQGGGAFGKGVEGDHKADAFRAGTKGAEYGALVGLELLFVDVWIEHDQFRSSKGLTGTWTQFMTGMDVELDLGSQTGGDTDKNGVMHDGYASGYGEFGMGLGFGLGTGRQIDPPLDNAQVTDKGFLVQAEVGLGYHLTRHLSLGLSFPFEAGYLFKSGPGTAANDLSTHYVEIAASAMLNLRLKFQLK